MKALINTSLHYSSDVYERERLEEMKEMVKEMARMLGEEVTEEKLEKFFDSDLGYVTPKVDVRAVVLDHAKRLLLVKEKSDGKWALPGDWADVGHAPSEVAEKELFEEAGLKGTAMHLIKVVDKAKHAYPQSIEYVYKFFFYCEVENFNVVTGIETSDVKFFTEDEVRKLACIPTARNTHEDLLEAISFDVDKRGETKFD